MYLVVCGLERVEFFYYKVLCNRVITKLMILLKFHLHILYSSSVGLNYPVLWLLPQIVTL